MANLKKKQYILEGLDCANCAEKIRARTEKLVEIEKAEMNFMKKEMTVYFIEGADEHRVFEKVEKVVKDLEPDVELTEKTKKRIAVKKYTLEGLDCAHCAEKIRAKAEQLEEIELAEMNFVQKQLTVHIKDDADESAVFDKITSVVKSLEPDVEVHEKLSTVSVEHNHDHNHEHGHSHGHEHSHESDDVKGDIIKIAIAAVLFIIGFIMNKVLAPEAGLTWQFLTTLALFIASYLVVGLEVLYTAFRNITKGNVFDENFLMTVATLGAFAIQEFPEAVAVMLFYQVGELFQSIAVNNSRKSIAELMNIRPDYANIKTAEGTKKVDPDTVKIGDIIVVKPGEKIPLDGKVVSGSSCLDTSALTGESAPRDVEVGDAVLSGSINENGILEIEVTKEFGESTASKILELVENADSKKAKTENFITKFAKYYTPAVVACAVLIAIVPGIFLGNFPEWIHRGLIFLVISCPCALVISIPLSYFGAIGRASKDGILVKGSNYFEILGSTKAVVFDKTGTLTKGVFKVSRISPVNIDSDRLLEYGAYSECYSSHPIGVSIRAAYGKAIDESRISDYKEVAGEGTEAVIDGRKICSGNSKLMNRLGISAENHEGETVVFIAVDGVYAGSITIADEIKNTSKSAVAKLKELGMSKIVMLTGDNALKAEKTAKELGITEYHAELLPQDKITKVEEIKKSLSENDKLIFVGDGINDAPVLAAADVGIAMGGLGSDSAIEAADIVLMNDEPEQIVTALNIAKKTKRIVMENIIFALAVKLLVQILGVAGVANMWEAVFADVGVSILAILNSIRLLRK